MVVARRIADDLWGVFYARSIQCMGEYYFGKYTEAMLHAEEAIGLPGFYLGAPASGFLLFFYSLSILAVTPKSAPQARQMLAKVNKMQDRFQAWAQRAPMNYLHKWQLVEAERHRVLGHKAKAVAYFELALKGAKENSFPNDEALISELAGRFYLAEDRPMLAQLCLEQAHASYCAWGANAKALQLEGDYPALLGRVKIAATVAVLPTERGLDLETIIKASQTLSGEIQLDKLLEKLMRLLIENAGAQRGMLLLQRHGALVIDARLEADAIEVRQNLSVAESTSLSLGIVNYVKRSRENVVLGDASNDGRFNADPYIVRTAPKSVLCIPLQKQSALVGILYLENNLAVDAFTHEHTELLQMLSTQIAMSLENAVLYDSLVSLSRSLESQVAERTHDLSIAKDLAESANHAKSDFLAVMSHEIRTPMNGVLGMTQMALAEATDPKQREYLETAQYSAEALLTILNDILDFSKLEAGKLEFEKIDFDLIKTVETIISLMSARAREKQVGITFDFPLGLPRFVLGDGGRLRQVLLNLISNALKFTDEGGVNVRIEALPESSDGATLRFTVSDTGIGIEPEVKARLFQSFTQADSSISRRFGGTGLGLSICKKIIEMQGGRIGVDSRAGKGSQFWFELRLPPAPPPVLTSDTTTINKRQLPTLDILLAEDNIVNQKVAIALLSRCGHRVHVANNGLEALEAVRAADFDVVLMDMHMPEMDGLEATRAIRNLPGHAAALPIVALTAAGALSDVQICMDAGMNYFLTKPIRIERLQGIFSTILPASRMQREMSDK